MRHAPLRCLALVLAVGLFMPLPAADKPDKPDKPDKAPPPSPVQELRVQKVGDVTYFHVRLEPPRDLMPDRGRNDRGWWFAEPSPSLTPKLISSDGQVRLVCERFNRDWRNPDRFGVPVEPLDPEAKPKEDKEARDKKDADEKKAGEDKAKEDKDRKDKEDKDRKDDGKKDDVKKDDRKDKERPREPRQPVPVKGLEFVGRTDARGEVKLKLLYPIPGKPLPGIGRLSRTPPPPVWKEMEVVLDFGKAKDVAIPKEAADRKEKPRKDREYWREPPVRDDLEGLWAVAQSDQFLDLDNEVTEFGYYSFAATATARKYGVQGQNNFSPRMQNRWQNRREPRGEGVFDRELYETTTGAAAVTESLQLRRMNELTPPDKERRTVAIAKVQGIDIAEHPWEKMIGDKKPAPEPFAQMVPHDNYYIHFKQIARFIEFTELMDQWGTTLTRAYEVTSRDHRLKERYEQQICLRSTALGKKLGPLVIKGVGITGSDAYIREGSDVTILFQVTSKEIFFSAVEPFLAEARKKFGGQLKEGKDTYHEVTIESFVTPLREVSLHRATLDDMVIYSNSPAGVRRVLDATQGRIKKLSESLDFQYMRTVFRYDDKDEDGFAFLSDPFIRNLVGPASKIKEKRRLEALASLHMLTHGAMLTAWETGKAPVSTPNILQAAGLKLEEIPMPEGKAAVWDPEKLAAVSETYNTIHFATPLIELAIDEVTKTEAEEYRRFRLEYLGLWRQYFDPIGMRVSLKDGTVKLDTYILPLIENSAYNSLRAVTGKGTVRLDPAALSSKTLFQYAMHLSTDAAERGGWFGTGGGAPRGPLQEFGLTAMLAWAVDPVGEWFLVRLDDSPNYEKLVKMAEKMDKGEEVDVEEVARLVWTLPVAIGFDVKNPLTLTTGLTALRTSAMLSMPGALTWAPLEKEYKGVSIVRVQATPAGREMLGQVWGDRPRRRKDAFLPAIYYAMIDGAFYVSLNEDMMHELIDTHVSTKEGKVPTVDVNTSLHLAPGAAQHSKGLLKRYLEMQTNHQARTSLPIWYALHRCGIVADDAAADQAAAAAYRYLGYVPVSPDGTAFRYDRKYDEVVNERHGSFRKPVLERTTADGSPVNRLLETLQSLRADLRFREDGIHTVLTLERAKSEK